MTMILKETNHTAEFLLSEGDESIAREQVTVAAGGALLSGTVLGIVTATGEYAPYNHTATDGTEIAVAVLYTQLGESAQPRQAVIIARLSEVIRERLTGVDAAAEADLKTRYIIVR
ncbi:MAG: head decoration protein [Desulfobulbus sp.]|nr:head decoration protein [Desulfobulbus sp.]